MSLPRELHLNADGTVSTTPPPELVALRRSQCHAAERVLLPGQVTSFDEVRGDALEIIAELRPNPRVWLVWQFAARPTAARRR